MILLLNKNIVFLILYLFTAILVYGQNKYNFSQLGNETQKFIKQPYYWNGTDLLYLGLIGTSTFILMNTVDEPVRQTVLLNQNYAKSYPIEFGRLWGEPYTNLIFSASYLTHSWLANDVNSRKIGYEIGQSAIYTGALVYLIKLAFGRERPYMNKGNQSYYPFQSLFNSDNKSLPSGHSAMAFSLSTVLSKNSNSDLIKVISYLPAMLTIISRVYQDKHWVSDTFLGAAIGYLIANWVVKKHEFGNPKREELSVYPVQISIPIF